LTGWRDGDPVAARRFADLGPIDLEFGERLPSVRMAYEAWGEPRRDEHGAIINAVLVLHALTGDAHVVGPAGPGQVTPGWWDGLIGPGCPLDTGRWYVLAANVLGGCQGTTGPWSHQPFPQVTIRDQVRTEAMLGDQLGINRFVAVLGGSMGGMRALEWPLMFPTRVGASLVLAVGARATADQIGTQTTQIAAIRADPLHGLGLARRIAHLSYRAELELDARFGNSAQGDGFAAQSYLEHHADKLERRFDADSYITLTEAMNTYDVGRGRGGVSAALASIRTPIVIGGITTDRLYPLRLQREIAGHVPTCDGVRVVESPYGHDGFLIEIAAVGELVRDTLALSAVASRVA